jgi:hypothetical protein
MNWPPPNSRRWARVTHGARHDPMAAVPIRIPTTAERHPVNPVHPVRPFAAAFVSFMSVVVSISTRP